MLCSLFWAKNRAYPLAVNVSIYIRTFFWVSEKLKNSFLDSISKFKFSIKIKNIVVLKLITLKKITFLSYIDQCIHICKFFWWTSIRYNT